MELRGYDEESFEDQPIKRRFSAKHLLILPIFVIGYTFAANINLSTGTAVEFGQGVQMTTTCDDEITVTPEASFKNVQGAGAFYFTSIRVSGVSPACTGKVFTLKGYASSGNTPLDIYSSSGNVVYNNIQVFDYQGTFSFIDSGLPADALESTGDGFVVSFISSQNPASSALASSASLSRMTLESGEFDTDASARMLQTTGVVEATIGFQGPLTGSEAVLGISQQRGVRLAIDQFNSSQSRIHVNLVNYDDQGDPAVANVIAPTAAANSNLLGIVGSSYSGSSRLSFPYYKAANLSMVSPSATNPILTDPTNGSNGIPIFHRLLPPVPSASSSGQGKLAISMANLVSTLNLAQPIEIISFDDSNFSSWVSDDIKEVLSEKKITYQSYVVPSSSSANPNFTTIASAVAPAYGATVIYVPSLWGITNTIDQGAGAMFNALVQGGYAGQYVTTDIDGGSYFNNGFAATSGSISTKPPIVISSVFDYEPLGSSVVSAYIAKYGSMPEHYIVESINAANVLLNGILNGANTKIAMGEYIDKYKGVGIAGNQISFDANGDVVNPLWGLRSYDGTSWNFIGTTYLTSKGYLNPTFGSRVNNADGYTVQITNFDHRFTWKISGSSGTAKINSRGLITVTGLGSNSTATHTVTTIRAGYFNGVRTTP